jgi:hypothetical protein
MPSRPSHAWIGSCNPNIRVISVLHMTANASHSPNVTLENVPNRSLGTSR